MNKYILLFIATCYITGCGATISGYKVGDFTKSTYSYDYDSATPIVCEEENFQAAAKVVIGGVTLNKKTKEYYIEWNYFRKTAVGQANGSMIDQKRSASINGAARTKRIKRCWKEIDPIWMRQSDYDRKYGGQFKSKIEIYFNNTNLVDRMSDNDWIHMGDYEEWSIYSLNGYLVLTIPVNQVKNNSITLTVIKELPYHMWTGKDYLRASGTNTRQYIEEIVIKLK